MKTSRFYSSLLVAVVGLILPAAGSTALALGGVGGAAGGTGAGAGGGGHGGGVSSGGAHASSVGGVGHASSAMGAGFHSGLSARPSSFGNGATSYAGAPHYLPGGFTPNVSGQLSSRSRSSSVLTASRPVTASQRNFGTPRNVVTSPARVRNAWTDSSTRGGRTTARQVEANLGNRSDTAYRQYIASGNYSGLTGPDGIAGTYLYPGAYGSALNSYYNGLSPRGALNGSGPVQNYAQEQRWYGPNAGNHPYWPNGYRPYFGNGYPFFGGYGIGYGGFGYGYGGDGDGLSGAYNNNTAQNNGADLNNGDQSVATVEDGQPRPAANQQPSQPTANQQPPEPVPADAAVAGSLGNGPDSLVEAVQAELGRRGYFNGKVDAIYGPATKDALSRFQTDQRLNATGRVNEATLHALQLD